jgi:hypothetical protein
MAGIVANMAATTGLVAAVVVAVVTAVGSLVVAVTSQVLSRRANKELALESQKTSESLALLNARLEEEAKTRDARLDYEYEAKKRLYEECEPLLFQTIELAEGARTRIKSLARTARREDIRADGSGWLAEDGYYFKSTAFQLLAPMTSFKILQRRLTAIDLNLEPGIRRQYEMLKLLFYSFASDFDLAGVEPKLSYDPDKADPGENDRERLLGTQPEVYARQGLYRGSLEVVVEALLCSDNAKPDDMAGGFERCMTFGEFLTAFETPSSRINAIRPYLDELFRGFHPRTKPVLWRVLVGQTLLYDEFLAPHSGIAATVEADFEWRSDSVAAPTKVEASTGPEDTATTVRAATTFVDVQLAQLRKLLEPSG